MTTIQERKRKERQVRRLHIQTAAREVFAERGFAKTSIEQVARRASLSVGAIYLYFRSKEDLYVSLLEDTLAMFDRELSALHARPEVPVRARLQASWSFLTDWAVSDVEGARVLRVLAQPGVRAQLSDLVAEGVAAGVRAVRAHLATMLRSGVETGDYRAIDPDETADVLWSMLLGLLDVAEAHRNLSIDAPSFTASAQAAFAALEAGLRPSRARVAEAA